MPIGHRDWGAGAPGETTPSLSDMAELAARLGSPVRYYRTGRVIYQTDAEASLSSLVTVLGSAGSSVVSYNGVAFSGDRSIRLQTGAVASDSVSVYKIIGLTSSGNIGAEWAVYTEDASLKLVFAIVVQLNNVHIQFAIQYEPSLTRLSYLNSSSVYTAITSALSIPLTGKAFSVVKLVIDPINRKYLRFYVNQKRFDLTSLSGVSFSFTAADSIYALLSLYNTAGTLVTSYLDNFIFTTDEPNGS